MGLSAGNSTDRWAYVRDVDILCWSFTVSKISSYGGRLSAQNWMSSRQLQQSFPPLSETEDMAALPYMTYSSVQCDESQTTKGHCWQLSLIAPSVHLDAATDQCCGEHEIIKSACRLITFISILKGLVSSGQIKPRRLHKTLVRLYVYMKMQLFSLYSSYCQPVSECISGWRWRFWNTG